MLQGKSTDGRWAPMKVRLSHFNNVWSLFVAMVVCGASIATEYVARADVLAADATHAGCTRVAALVSDSRD